MNIIQAINDPKLFQPYLGDLSTWRPWFAALRTLYGLPLGPGSARNVRRCTGRDPSLLPADGFDTALFLTGRRSGKSRVAGLVGAYEATIAGHETKLAPGETGVVAICSPTRKQSKIVKKYVRAALDTDLLRGEVVRETDEGFQLRNGIVIDILAGDFRTVRGHTLVAAIVDEAAFFGYDDEAKVRSDTELIRAIKPSLATTGGKLIAISSPYARRGWCYTTHKRYHGNDAGRTLVWSAPSRRMNPTLPQRVVDEAMEEDLQAAKSEYLGEFRDDVSALVSRTTVEAAVVSGRLELLPNRDTTYTAFADLSGGRADDAALAIGHRDGQRVIIDRVWRWRPPHNPQAVIVQMAAELRRYGVSRVNGDNYAAEFAVSAFASSGIRFIRSKMAKSELYLELLPLLSAGEVELTDDPHIVTQLAGLERKPRSGGRDSVDHAPGGHDDLANVIAGVAATVATRRQTVGAL